MKKIGFIGSGAMAEALIKGLLASSYSAEDIFINDIVPERKEQIAQTYGVEALNTNSEVARSSEIVFLCVKPGQIEDVVSEISGDISEESIVVSIAAGTTTKKILRAAGKDIKLVRVMPNTPAIVQSGAFGVYFCSSVGQDERPAILSIFSGLGIVAVVEKEELMDAITGLSGSGPAFVAMFIEALGDAGVKMGLAAELSMRLAIQTVLGSAKMCLEQSIHPRELKDMVSSPGGTTIQGVSVLEDFSFRGAVIAAVEAAANRSKELSETGD